MNPNSEIRGTIRSALAALLRARQALLEGVEDPDVMLTPADMENIRHTLKDMAIVLGDVKKASALFGSVADARAAMLV